MPSEPSWWYDPRPRLVTRLLRPAGAIYGHVALRRMREGPGVSAVSPLPVICVGNFTAGGTGKTPLTRYIAETLMRRGARVAILSRGYGGSVQGPHWVDLATDSAAQVGDEPRLLAGTAPVMVARDRVSGARAIEADPRRFTCILMDDGLQNRSLMKTLRIAVVDGVRGFGNGLVIPAGPLRAPLDGQLEHIDAIIVNHGARTGVGGPGHSRSAPAHPDAHALATNFRGPLLAASIAADVETIAALKPGPVVAFAGIAVPAKFFDMLRHLGVDVLEVHAFADHHAFTAEDGRHLLDRAAACGARLVTTEKDLARLQQPAPHLTALAAAITAVPVRVVLSSADAATLAHLLDDAIEGAIPA